MGHDDREQPDVSRRDLGSLLGVLGGAAGFAALSACASRGAPGDGQLGRVSEPLGSSASAFGIAQTVLGSPSRTGDLATKTNATLVSGQTTSVVVAQYCAQQGDGGGGVFYWSTTTITDDGGTFIVPVPSDGGAAGVGATGPGWVRVYDGPLNVLWFGAYKDHTNPGPTQAAIQNAVSAAIGLGGGEVYFPPGTYAINSTITINSGQVHLKGAGLQATVIDFQPSADGAAFVFGQVGTTIWYCSIEGMQFESTTDTTHNKTMVQVVDVRGFVARAVGSVGTLGHTWTGGSTPGSIGIDVNGREEIRIRDCYIYADLPIYFHHNPNLSTNSLDHSSVEGTTLVVNVSNKQSVTFEGSVVVTNVAFRDCAFVGGTGAILMATNTSNGTSIGILIENCRTEQSVYDVDLYNYVFTAGGVSQIQFVSFKNVVLDPNLNGIRLGNVLMATIDTVLHSRAGLTALQLDSYCRGLSATNFYYEAGSSISLSSTPDVQLLNCLNGTADPVNIDSALPTSNTGLPSGSLWVDTANSNVLKRVT